MENNDRKFGLFGLREEGVGLGVPKSDSRVVSHEVLFEDDYTQLKERPMFLGKALSRARFMSAFIVVGVIVSVLMGRAFWMQVVQGQAYQIRAEDNRLRHEIIPARRGVVRDRSGIVIAENVPSFDLDLLPRFLPTEIRAQDDILARVGRETGVALSDIHAMMASSTSPDEILTIVRDLSYERAIAINVLLGGNPAFEVVDGSKRRYPHSVAVESLSHVLGYVGPISRDELMKTGGAYRQTDVIGKTGAEASYEPILRGKAGERVYEVDARNRVTSLVADSVPQDGMDLTLTIDLELQRAAEEAMRAQMTASKLTRGSAVAIDPRDGSILAMVSLPAYDNNLFSGTVSSTYYAKLLQNEDRPLIPRAFAGTFPSGSTIKPVIATAALVEKVVTQNTSVNSVGGIRIGTSFFPDWKAGGHGSTNVRRALAWSVNTFFYYVGGGYESFIGLGVDKLSSWMRQFGLGSRTGLDLPGENPGFVPTREWKLETRKEPWYIGDTYNLSIGQGDLLVTPLQVAMFTAEVANGGKRITPHVAKVDASALPVLPPVTEDAAAIRTVQLGMRDTVIYGSGRALASMPINVAGKTGTAQWRNDRANHAWFTSFAPFENPEIVVTVLLEEGGEGSAVAVPVVRKILDAWVHLRSRSAQNATYGR